MTTDDHAFDRPYWEQHWSDGPVDHSPPHPYLAGEVGGLRPGTALDAGCGTGAEATWLAAHGWQVTAADISAEALARAAHRPAAERVEWVRADLTDWTPGTRFDLVTTAYAHPAMPQLDFYERIAEWVAPGGTLLVVGHLHGTHASAPHGAASHGHGSHAGGPPAEASATAAAVVARLDEREWDVVTAEELHRTRRAPDGREVGLRDVVVRAVRRG